MGVSGGWEFLGDGYFRGMGVPGDECSGGWVFWGDECSGDGCVGGWEFRNSFTSNF